MEIITSLIASISTLIGYLFVYFNVKNINRCICISLSFCASIMLLISLKELLPISIKYILLNNSINNATIILISIPVAIYLIIKITNNNNNSLYRVGVVTLIAMIIHNILEGIITMMSSVINIKLGLKLTLAILIHNISEGICISIPIYYSTKSKNKALIYTFIASISELLGSLIIYYIFKNYLNSNILNILLYITGSLMIIIAIKEIYKESLKYKNILWFITGIILSLFILLIWF